MNTPYHDWIEILFGLGIVLFILCCVGGTIVFVCRRGWEDIHGK